MTERNPQLECLSFQRHHKTCQVGHLTSVTPVGLCHQQTLPDLPYSTISSLREESRVVLWCSGAGCCFMWHLKKTQTKTTRNLYFHFLQRRGPSFFLLLFSFIFFLHQTLCLVIHYPCVSTANQKQVGTFTGSY